MQMRTLPLSGCRKALPQIIKSIDENFERINITVNGISKAVMLAPEELEDYEETIEVLGQQELMQALLASEKDLNSGKVFSHDEVFA